MYQRNDIIHKGFGHQVEHIYNRINNKVSFWALLHSHNHVNKQLFCTGFFATLWSIIKFQPLKENVLDSLSQNVLVKKCSASSTISSKNGIFSKFNDNSGFLDSLLFQKYKHSMDACTKHDQRLPSIRYLFLFQRIPALPSIRHFFLFQRIPALPNIKHFFLFQSIPALPSIIRYFCSYSTYHYITKYLYMILFPIPTYALPSIRYFFLFQRMHYQV